jgi:uncharacterized membrane protein
MRQKAEKKKAPPRGFFFQGCHHDRVCSCCFGPVNNSVTVMFPEVQIAQASVRFSPVCLSRKYEKVPGRPKFSRLGRLEV